MALAVTSIVPSSIPSVGEFVIELTGVGFGVVPQPTVFVGVTPTPPPAMRVRVGGNASDRVYAISTTRCAFRAPPLGAGVHALIVERMNPDGTVAEATATTLTVTQAVTATGNIFRRPNLTRVVETLILLLRRAEPNTRVHSSKDFAEHPDNPAKMPWIRLANIRLVDAPGWRFNTKKYEDDNGTLRETPNRKVARVLIAVLVVAQTAEHLLTLQTTVMNLIEATPRLRVQRDQNTDADGFVAYDLSFNEEAGIEAVFGNETDFYQTTIGVAVTGVEIDADTGPLLDEAVGLTMPIQTFDHPGALASFATKKE